MSVADALLQDILDQAKISNTHLATLLRQSAAGGGGGGGGGGPNPIQQNIARFNILNGVLSGIAKVGNIVSNVFSSIFNFAGKVVGEFHNLAQKAFEGTAKFSDLFGAAERITRAIPLLGAAIGPVIGLFQKFVAYQEELLTTYQQLTKVGASFSGDLIEMRLSASRAYMTLDKFGEVVRINSSLFSTSMGGVDAGIKTFTAAQNKLVDPNGPFGKNLQGLGVTAEEAGSMLAAMMNQQGNMANVNRRNTNQMAESTFNLIQNLDAYAKLTGESREALAEKMKKEAMDVQFQAFMSALDPKEVELANLKLTAAMQMGGKGAEDNMRMMLMSGGKILHAGTEAANQFMVTTRGMGNVALQNLAAVKSQKDFIKVAEESRQGVGKYTSDFTKMVGGPGQAGVLSFLGAMKLSDEQARTMVRTRGETETAEQKASKIRKEQEEKQFKSTAAALGAAQMQLKIFGNEIGERFFSIIRPLNEPIMKVGSLLMDSFGGVIKYLTAEGGPMTRLGEVIKEYLIPAIEWTANWVKETFISLADSKSATDFFSRLGDRFSVVWNKISDVLGPPFKKFWEETAKPMLADMFERIMDWIITALRKNSRIARFLFNETETEKEEKAKRENDPIYQKILEEFTIRNPRTGRVASIDEKSAIEKYEKEIEKLKAEAASAARHDVEAEARRAMLDQSRHMTTAGGRAGGSLGATGKLFENFGAGTAMELHGNEGVITPTQLSDVVATALKQQENNQLNEKFNQLNNLTQQLINIMRENADNTRRSYDAIQNLNGNLLM